MEQELEKLKKLMQDVKTCVNSLDIQGKENFDFYYYKDIQEIDQLIKKCERCGKYFFPSINFKKHQKYCGDDCRYNSTLIKAKRRRLDYKDRQIDLLRKTIYEYRYRCNRDGIRWSKYETKTIENILVELTKLRKNRNNLSRGEITLKVSELRTLYHNTRYV